MPSQYEPRTAPVFNDPNLQLLVSYITRELDQISDAFTGVQAIMLQELHAPPAKFFKGMIVMADGTNWNPDGIGRKGFYGYDGSSWQRLG